MDMRQWSRRRGILVVCFLLLVTLAIAFLRPKRIHLPQAGHDPQTLRAQLVARTQERSQAAADTHFEKLHGADVMWQVPSNPSAVLFLAHGCVHTALDFWEPSQVCPQCRGLPEDLALKEAALTRGYAVIAVSSQGGCWDSSFPPEDSQDVQIVKKVLDEVRAQEKLQELPLYALGASSGGYFVTVLAHAVSVEALGIYIAAGIKQALREPLANGGPFPPSLFVHMPRDKRIAAAVKEAVQELRQGGSDAAELECLPLPITPHFFAERIQGLDSSASEMLCKALSEGNFLDSDGFLQEDPRRSAWFDALMKASPVIAERFEFHISEELNLAYASHELTSLKAAETFDWFEGNCWQSGRKAAGRCKEHTS